MQLCWTASLHKSCPERKYVSLSRLTGAFGKVSLERLTYRKVSLERLTYKESSLERLTYNSRLVVDNSPNSLYVASF